MSSDQRLGLILTFISVIGLPSIGLSLRLTAKWTRVEARLEETARSVVQLVKDKDQVHLAIQQEIRDDRAATDRRLRWLEEHLWRRDGEHG